MGYLLLWLFLLGALVSWFAAALATPARVSNLAARIVIRLLLGLVPAAAAAMLFGVAVGMHTHGLVHPGDAWVVYVLLGLFAPMAVVFLGQRWWRRPAEWREIETKAIRRRTVGALYGLSMLLLALHVITAFVLARAAVGTVEAALSGPQAAAQAQLDADHARWEPILAARELNQPRDFVTAYKEFYNDPNPQVKARREAMSAWLNSWYSPVFQAGQSPTTFKGRIIDWCQTYTPEDQIEETLPETLTRFAPEIEALRQLAEIAPYKANATVSEFDEWNEDDPLMAIQGLVNQLKVDAAGTLAQGDLVRAARDLKAINKLSDRMFERGNWIGELVGIACRGIGQDQAEAYLSARGATVADLDALTLDEVNVCQGVFPRAFEGDLGYQLRFLVEAARGNKDPLRSDVIRPPMGGYPGLLLRAYVPPTMAADLLRVSAEIRPLLDHSYHQTVKEWNEDPNFIRDGGDGAQFRRSTGVILGQAVVVDTHDDLLRVGRAAAKYKLQHGTYPADLTVLLGEYLSALPKDPFNNQPLKFRIEDQGQGLVIWSVGRNLKDDGATVVEECEHADTDITLFLGTSYEAAAAAAQKARQDRSK